MRNVSFTSSTDRTGLSVWCVRRSFVNESFVVGVTEISCFFWSSVVSREKHMRCGCEQEKIHFPCRRGFCTKMRCGRKQSKNLLQFHIKTRLWLSPPLPLPPPSRHCCVAGPASPLVYPPGLLHGDALELRVQQRARAHREGRRAPRPLPHLEEGLVAQDGLDHHRSVLTDNREADSD